MRTDPRCRPICVSRSEGGGAAAPAGDFARRLLAWHRSHGRRDLPWLRERDPYRVWLSEIMLQQTQVATVLPYFKRFIGRFADVRSLARAPVEDVMAAWSGLGYYARARNLHACARTVVERHHGRFPASSQALASLPGIGASTAAAIAAFCFDERAAVLDGNVKRVLARHWEIDGDPGAAAVSRRLWQRAQLELPAARQMARYTQAIMDLGATVCTRLQPSCDRCPVSASCLALKSGRTAELPTAPARRERPLRHAHVLVALAGRSVLLQRREPDGIWGGLMCLPEFGSKAALVRRARALGAAAPLPLPPRRHLLTHLALTIEPYLALAGRTARADVEGSLRWVPLAQIDQEGLPAPHKELLQEVRDHPRVQPSPPPLSRVRGRGAIRCAPAKV
jgi:A/G-specific adenine glycosylase